MIKKTPSGWLVDIQPNGRGGKRYRKTLPTKAEALRWEAWLIAKVTQEPEWQPARKDTRRLSDLIELWYEGHGQQLRDGRRRYGILKRLVHALDNPNAEQLTATQFVNYRARRLNEGTSEATTNREHAYLRSLFNELTRLGHWNRDNPLEGIRQFKERQRQELGYLKPEEITQLLSTLEGDARTVAQICLATGARWSEAERLRAEQISKGMITFTDTKSGRNRSVPINAKLAEQIGKQESGRLFKPCYDEFRRGVKRASLKFPERQMTHILRHSFASYFMMKGGNILVLQRILGHQSLTMTMRYSHFAPEHLQDAIRLNPLNFVDSSLTPLETIKEQK
ncbi:MAG: tyrosine-type recombinase/integrase [Candidatus Competibacter sp.]|nr:tyrosine-type recombinase/integrase [Candidatus Competibacter sp.]